MNLWFQNTHLGLAQQEINRRQPDIIALQEYEPHIRAKLEQLKALKHYPYKIYNDDVALYSQHPLVNPRFIAAPGVTGESRLISAQILWQKQPVTVLVAHTPTPFYNQQYADHVQWFKTIMAEVYKAPGPTLLVGDLNTTPWSYPYSILTDQKILQDTQQDAGLQPSWPTFLLGLPWLAIDHCLVSQHWYTAIRQVDPYTGSDHYPVYLELALKPQP